MYEYLKISLILSTKLCNYSQKHNNTGIQYYEHRPLHCYMDINDDFEDYHRRPTFPELFVTKLVVTQGTTRYQMKDMDIIFLLIPIGLLWVKWFGFYSLSK